MGFGRRSPVAPEMPGGTTTPARFLTLDYARPAASGPPPFTAPAFLPPPGIGTDGPASPAAGAAAGTGSRERRRLDPRRRRIIEAAALAMLIPLTLGLEWFDEVRLVQVGVEPAEKITVVPHDRTADMAHSRWLMGGRLPEAKPAADGSRPAGGTTITLVIGVKALDPQGTKEASASNLKFRLVDRAGNEWSATADYQGENVIKGPPVGKPVPIEITAQVPANMADQLVLDVVQSGAWRPKGPVPVLRFAH